MEFDLLDREVLYRGVLFVYVVAGLQAERRQVDKGGDKLKLSIADAAKEAGVTRQHLYKLRDGGKITFESDAKGRHVVDSAELYRVFPVVNRHHHQAPSVDNPQEAEIRLLRAELTEYRERERRHLNTIERLTLLLEHRPGEGAQPDHRPGEEVRRGFWARLFGR